MRGRSGPVVPSFHPAKNNVLHIAAKTIFSRQSVAFRDVELLSGAAVVAIDAPASSKGSSSAGVALEKEALVGGYE